MTHSYATRLVDPGETLKRLFNLPEAPVVDRASVEQHFRRFITNLQIFKDDIPPIQWLDGPHNSRNLLLDQGVFVRDTKRRMRLQEWQWTIERGGEYRTMVNANLPVWVRTLHQHGMEPPGTMGGYIRNSLYCDEHYLCAIEAGLGHWIVNKFTIVLFPRPVMRFFDENRTRRVLHSTIAPAVEYPDHPQSNQYWYRGIRVPEFVIMNPQRITLAHIRAASSIELRRAMIDRYGLLKYAQQRGYVATSVDQENNCILWVKGGKHDGYGNITQRLCILEMINATPEPDGSHRHFARRVDSRCQTARDAVAWTFHKTANDYHPVKQT